MDSSKNSPFVAPDVIALLCKDNNNPILLNEECKANKKPLLQGKQKEFNGSPRKKQPYNQEHIPLERYSSLNLLPVDFAPWPKNKKNQNYNNRSQSRSSFHSVTESLPAENVQVKNKNSKKDNRSQNYKDYGHHYNGNKYSGHIPTGNKHPHTQKNLNKGKSQEGSKNENSTKSELGKHKNGLEHELKKDKCLDVIISDGKDCAQALGGKQPANLLGGGSIKLTADTEISRAVENFVAANVTGIQNNNTGAIPKVTPTLRPLNSLIAKNVPERSVKLSFDSSKSKLQLLIIQHHFVDNLEAIKSFVQDNYTKETVSGVVEEAFELMSKKNTQSRERTGLLVSELMRCGLISNVHVTDVLNKLYINSVGTTDDCPLSWICIAEFIVPMIRLNCFSFLDLQNAGKPFLKTKLAKHLLLPVFNKLIGYEGFGLLQSKWKSSGVSLEDFIPNEELNEFLMKNNLQGLYEQKLTNLEEIQKHVQENLKPFMERRERLEHALQLIVESVSCIEDVFVSNETNDLLQNILSSDVVKDEASANYIAFMLSDMFEFGFIQPDMAAKHMNTIFDGDNIKNNCQVLQLFAQIIAHLVISERFEMHHVTTAILPILKTPQALNFFLKFFNVLKQKFGDKKFHTWLKLSKISLYDLVDRSHVKGLVQHFGLHYLDTNHNVQLQQPLSALNIQQELVEMIKNREKVDDIKDWISVHAGGWTKDRVFIRDLISAVCEGSLSKGFDASVFNTYKTLISNYTKTNDKEIHTLFILLKLVTRDHKSQDEETKTVESLVHREMKQVTTETKTNNPIQVGQNKGEINPMLYSIIHKVKEQTPEVLVTVKNPPKVATTSDVCTQSHKLTTTETLVEQGVHQAKVLGTSDTIKSSENIDIKNDLSVKQAAENTQLQQKSETCKVSEGYEEKDQQSTASNSEKKDDAPIRTQSLEQIQIHIIEGIKKGAHYRYIKQYIDENLAEDNKGACFIKILTNCVLQTSFNEDSKTFKADNVAYYGRLLRLCIDGNRADEIIVLCAVQDFIKVRTELKEYISNTFQILFNEEIISKDAFFEFMDKKIKGDVLRCLTTFYDKLMED